jgi:hypothetical protein
MSFQTFTRFVEIGRVAYIAFGPDEGKLVTIVDVVDQGHVSRILILTNMESIISFLTFGINHMFITLQMYTERTTL